VTYYRPFFSLIISSTFSTQVLINSSFGVTSLFAAVEVAEAWPAVASVTMVALITNSRTSIVAIALRI